jgi:hypothetical protein
MPGEPKAIGQIRQAAKQLSAKAQFPIRNIADLLKAVGGEDAEFELLGKKHKVREVHRLVPQDYFPIESEEDLTEKLANLDAMRADSPLRQTEMAKEEPRSPDRTPPPRSEQGRPSKRSDGPSMGKGVKQ